MTISDPTPPQRPVPPAEPSAPSDDVLRARAFLLRVTEPPCPVMAGLVREVGPVEAADRVRAGRVAAVALSAERVRQAEMRVESDLAGAGAAGLRLLVPESPEWPAGLAVLDTAHPDRPRAPLGLWARGPARLSTLAERAVAVIGSRAASGYGLGVTSQLASVLAAKGVTIVSGGALGVDGSAARAALAAGGPTIAVLACGADRSYPAQHAPLFDRIAQTGLVLSEYSPGTVPSRTRFTVRNRVVVAAARATVAVEAQMRSGTGQAARIARALRLPLFAVPGPITSAFSAGTHQMIREGATLLDSPDQVLDLLDQLTEQRS